MKEVAINRQITASEVRLIGENSEQLGIVSLDEALSAAENEGLDLVLISPNAVPPVCKIMDYGKYKFDQTKKQKEVRKKQKIAETKIIQLSLNIGQHDIEYRQKQARDFFADGSKVKISMMLKGRQQAYSARGIEIEKKFYEDLEDVCTMDKEPVLEGKFITVILSPKQPANK